MRTVLRKRPFMLAGLTLLAVLMPFDGIRADDPEAEARIERRVQERIGEVEVLPLEHLNSETAITMMRSILGIRQVAMVRSSVIAVSDHPMAIQAARELLEEIDVPVQEWLAELVTRGEQGESVIRRLSVGRSSATLHFGDRERGYLSVALDPHQWSGGELGATYGIEVRLARQQAESFAFAESGQASWDSERDLVVLDLRVPELQQRLADLLGQDAPVQEIRLRFRPITTQDRTEIAVAAR